MHEWQGADGLDNLNGWIDSLKPHGIFFSAPLDLDLAMLNAFPEAYAATIPKGGGPKMAVDKAAEAVLGTAGPGLALYAGAFKAYAEALSRETGQQVEPTKLVAPMLARFLASDRGFRSARRPAVRSRAPNPQPAPPPREPAA